MNLRPLLVPACLLTASGGLVAWLLLAEPPADDGGNSVASAETAPLPASGLEPAMPATTVPARPPQTTAPLPDDIRNVSPEGVSAPKVDGGLKRIEPSKRYLELKDPPVEPIPDGPLELVRVQVLDGGNIKSDRLTVTLAHITPLKLDETCLSRLGGNWPCGTRARTFLRGLVRQFKVTCEKIEETGPQQILATCTRGNFDLSKRLVQYGWADPAEGAPADFTDLANNAREKKIGKWQSEWLADLPKTGWEGDPAETLPGLEDLEPEIVEWSLRTNSAQPGQQGLETDIPAPLQ